MASPPPPPSTTTFRGDDEEQRTKTSPTPNQKWPARIMNTTISELRVQRSITLPLMAMNLTWFAKIAITTAFLGRLGEIQLAGGTLGFTFANVTGFSVLNGLAAAMEPICGQAAGAKNFRLLHKTLVMTTLLLLLVTLPVTFLWLAVERILLEFGQRPEIAAVARRYVFYLLPDLVLTAVLCPLKAYLSSQSITVPIMFSSALALTFHVPANILLAKTYGLAGVAMAVWVTDVVVVVLLASYVLILEINTSWKEGGWWDQEFGDWLRLLKLAGPCCLTTCLEWWCYEILILLTGRLADASQAVGVLAIVMNFDYLLFSFMLSLSTCASIRVSNELGANNAPAARRSAYVSLAAGLAAGGLGSLAMVAARGRWGSLFSHDDGIVRGVKRMMLIMAVLEVVNFPLTVCGGIVRGTARPWLAMYANIGGFYLVALPLAVVLAFKVGLGLSGLLLGFLVGITACFVLLLVFVFMIDWKQEAAKAQSFVCDVHEEENENR